MRRAVASNACDRARDAVDREGKPGSDRARPRPQHRRRVAPLPRAAGCTAAEAGRHPPEPRDDRALLPAHRPGRGAGRAARADCRRRRRQVARAQVVAGPSWRSFRRSTVTSGPPRLPGASSPCTSADAWLASGGLWVHSPAPLDDELRDALAALERVRLVVAPSLLPGHVSLADHATAYPDAG